MRTSASGSHDDRCNPSSHVNYRYLTSFEKSQRLKESHQQNRMLQQQVKHLESRLENCVQRGVSVDSGLDELKEIVAEQSIHIERSYPKGSDCMTVVSL